jgi:GNAT superfamily N-acetyltransferase
VSDQERDLTHGEYGTERLVRPLGHNPNLCLRGHDLTIGGHLNGWSHHYQLDTQSCSVCWELQDERAGWCLADPVHQYTADTAPTSGLVLVRIPPAARGGLGQLQLRIDGVPHADLDLAVCGPCRRAVLEHVRVDESHRRQGYGRLLVAAALAFAPPGDYAWSTTKVDDTPVARAFWAGIGWPGELGNPRPCTDMDRATGRLPDW